MTSGNKNLPSYAIISREEAQYYEELTKKGTYDLGPTELFWRDRQAHLEDHGYMLRARYHPDWSPSWLGSSRDPAFCEDSIILHKFNVIDAIRQNDGFLVALKTTRNNSGEIAIASFLSSSSLRKDPSNHCIPVLDTLPDPLETNKSLLIMPYLRPFNDPEFRAIGEVVEFVQQTLEGLSFLHRNYIAHRDCAAANIMMDGRPLYPHGHHPVRRNYTTDGVFDVVPLSRLDCPVRYYFIDFGISTRFLEGSSTYVLGRQGRDKDVPELSSEVPYDAFKVDIFTLGNLYRTEFYEKYHGLDFLRPLITSMTQRAPDKRPTVEEVLGSFQDICASLNSVTLRWRLRSRAESPPERVLYDTVAVAREGIYHLKRLVA
ncbi:uncharacterized protein FIBRA_03580 [Fibroporia radiculosa]|uniref:Protein kinase domain-containing protein n=1 Tax=Fibroporia radiculosa TaxID=599839 RepID=J4H2H3_9APHY|nr:uncharacterized protein FIBRA_03580 [Fibroporia radiculosa]CCM01524.1 predicted protein [Fibroporia radiculosa]